MPETDSNDILEHAPVPASIPAEFPEILRDLNRAILKAQPNDIIAFCADYFTQKKADEPTVATLDYSQIQQSYTTGTTVEEAASELSHKQDEEHKELIDEEPSSLPQVES